MEPPRLPENPLNELLEVLELSQTSENKFWGRTMWMPHGRVFGGQVLAQSLIAATRTLQDDRPAHSLHGYFLRAGDINTPIDFEVEVLRDGRSFSTRRVNALQQGQPIFSLIASFQTADPGIEHFTEMPAGMPTPESIPEASSTLEAVNHPAVEYWSHARPFDIRHIPSPIYFDVKGPRVASQAVWIRALGKMPDGLTLHQAAIAFASDFSILEPALRRHGISHMHQGLSIASLDHAMWFHRPARADEWLLYVQDSPSAQGGRALSNGRLYTRQGILVASIAQEGMIRVPEIN